MLLAEHRLERCLPAADRVLALEDGADRLRRRARASSSTGRPSAAPAWRRPAARLFSLAGLRPAAGVGEGGARRRCAGAGAGAAAASRAAEPGRAPLRRATARAGARAATASGTRSRTARRSCAALDLELRPGRAGRADGPQRRRQEHAAAAREGAGRADARADRARRRGRAAAAEPGRLPDPRARRRRGRAGRRSRARGSRAASDANPRDLSGGERQRLALEVVLGGGPTSRSSARRADARHGPRPQGRARRRGSRSSRERARRWWSPRTTPSSPRRSPTASC